MSQDWVRDSNIMVSSKKIKFLQKYTSIITGRHAPVYNIIIWKNIQNVLLTRGISTMISIKNIFLLAS